METREYRNCDKSEWGDGPWMNEPDKLQWQDDATGLPCLIVRNSHMTGSLCGYVGLPSNHPDAGKGYDDVDVEVHGGLTYSDFCQPHADESIGICHVPAPGESDRVWWLGFDCSHAFDLSPAMRAFSRPDGDVYRDIDYVKGQVTHLAAQLKARAV